MYEHIASDSACLSAHMKNQKNTVAPEKYVRTRSQNETREIREKLKYKTLKIKRKMESTIVSKAKKMESKACIAVLKIPRYLKIPTAGGRVHHG